MMAANAAKDFGPIRDDYAFFEEHATEAANDLAAYVPGFHDAMTRRLTALGAAAATQSPGDRCRVLDFGCGPGTFSAKFLRRLDCPPDRLALSLVDPQPLYLGQAASSLAGFTTLAIRSSASLPSDAVRSFDLILSNHVLYYVADLDTTIPAIVEALAPGGIFQTAIAGHDNPLIQFWVAAFAMLGRPVPYHTAESVAAALDRHGITASTSTVPYDLIFPDSHDNRDRILRFLLAEHYPLLPQADLRRLFDPYASSGTIAIKTCSHHFVVTA